MFPVENCTMSGVCPCLDTALPEIFKGKNFKGLMILVWP